MIVVEEVGFVSSSVEIWVMRWFVFVLWVISCCLMVFFVKMLMNVLWVVIVVGLENFVLI